MERTLASILEGLNVVDTSFGQQIQCHSDWLIFVQRLQDLTDSRRTRRISPLRQEFAKNEEWYVDTANGEVYVYLPPDPPVLPLWKRVDPFATGAIGKAGTTSLDAIPAQIMTQCETTSLKLLLQILIQFGDIEIVDSASSSFFLDLLPDPTNTFYRDVRTGCVYRLAEMSEEGSGRWEKSIAYEVKAKLQ